jgi:hypothetical protein
LIITGPDGIRARFTGQAPASLVAQLAALRPPAGEHGPRPHLLAPRELGRRSQFLEDQLAGPGELIVPLVTARAPRITQHLRGRAGHRRNAAHRSRG